MIMRSNGGPRHDTTTSTHRCAAATKLCRKQEEKVTPLNLQTDAAGCMCVAGENRQIMRVTAYHTAFLFHTAGMVTVLRNIDSDFQIKKCEIHIDDLENKYTPKT